MNTKDLLYSGDNVVN